MPLPVLPGKSDYLGDADRRQNEMFASRSHLGGGWSRLLPACQQTTINPPLLQSISDVTFSGLSGSMTFPYFVPNTEGSSGARRETSPLIQRALHQRDGGRLLGSAPQDCAPAAWMGSSIVLWLPLGLSLLGHVSYLLLTSMPLRKPSSASPKEHSGLQGHGSCGHLALCCT